MSKITYLGVELVGKPYIEDKNYLCNLKKKLLRMNAVVLYMIWGL